MTNKESNKELELAWQLIEHTGTSIFLTGKAGTGKTTFLRKLKAKSPKRMVVLAPTGIAAINAGGVTIHSFLQLPFSPYVPLSENQVAKHKLNFQKEKRRIIKSLDLLVIDEISMVRADLLDAIDDVLRRVRRSNKPFGGVQMLMIGDLQQLAPVVKQEDARILKTFYRSFYFFGSHALEQTNYVTLELKKVYRQSDTYFLSLLNKIRTNTADEEVLTALNKRFLPNFSSKEEEGYIRLTTHNKQAQDFNEQRLKELEGKTYNYTCAVKANFPEYMYPADEKLVLKVGAQIMFLRNDCSPEKRFYNGKLGHIIELEEDSICVQCEGETTPFILEKEEWTNTRYVLDKNNNEIIEHIEGSFQQYPIRLAWSITIHKSQGLTFEKAIIDAASSFAHGQVYVALSRCKTLEGMVLTSKLTHNAIISDYQIDDFTRKTENQQTSPEKIHQLKQAYFLELLEDQFNLLPIYYQLQHITRLLDEHLYSLYPNLLKQYKEHLDNFKKQAIDVSLTFRKQYQLLVLQSEQPENDTFLQERIRKGAHYFEVQLTKWIHDLVTHTHVEIDNKEIKKQFKNTLAELNENLLTTLSTLAQTSKEGFHVVTFLKCKANENLRNEHLLKKESDKKQKKQKLEVNTQDDIKHIEVYNALLAWRKAKASEENIPGYCILNAKSLMGITNTLPSTADELLMIPGIGKIKVQKYGASIIEIIDEYAGVQGSLFRKENTLN